MPRSASEETWTAAELLERLERQDQFFILDVRNREEFERFRIEGRHPVPALNVPYFEMLEEGGEDDMVDSVAQYAERHLRSQLPSGQPVLSVCAKGGTSEFVAEALRRLGYPSINLEGGMAAWGGHYLTRALVEEPHLAIYQLSRPARGCLSYLVASAGKAVVIDPLRHLEPYLQLAGKIGATITAVLDTHGHADHISGGPSLAERTGACYYLHPYDGIHPMDLVPATIPYNFIRDGQRFAVGQLELEALHVPGHTLGMVAFRLGDYLFTGDSIFLRSIARPDLGGKADTWAPLLGQSLRRLVALPGRLTVLPGHFSSLDESDETGRFAASLDELKKRNDGLLALERESQQGFLRYLLESLPKFIPEYADIKRVNAGLWKPSEEEAQTLELGKNVCALAQAYASGGGAS